MGRSMLVAFTRSEESGSACTRSSGSISACALSMYGDEDGGVGSPAAVEAATVP